MPMVTVLSQDGVELLMDAKAAMLSGTIATMLQDFDSDEDGEDSSIPLLAIDADVLRKVIEWCTYHKDDPSPPDNNHEATRTKETPDLCAWDRGFVLANSDKIFQLAKAADFLHIEGLMDVTLWAVLDTMRDNSAWEIGRRLTIQDDLSADHSEDQAGGHMAGTVAGEGQVLAISR